MPEDLETLKHGPTESGVNDLILKRWSPRSYADKPVSTKDLTRIFTAAAWSASSSNEQPWRFFFGRKGDPTYAKIFDTLVDFNQSWAKTAPILVLSIAKKTFTKNGQPNYHALHDTGAASATFSLEATSLGLHTHGMAGFDRDKARANFSIPDDFEIGAVWTIGYLGEAAALPEHLQKMETAPRERKPIAEFVLEAWDSPATL